jgi:hypothetical protein
MSDLTAAAKAADNLKHMTLNGLSMPPLELWPLIKQDVNELLAVIERLGKERDALKVCGNCKYWRAPDVCDYDADRLAVPDGPCRFIPPRWTRRKG